MKLYKGSYAIILALLGVAALDLATGRLWLIAIYLAAASVLLFWEPNRIKRTPDPNSGVIIAPINGKLVEILMTKEGDSEVYALEIATLPFINSQYMHMPHNEVVDFTNFDSGQKTIGYKSGLVITHKPFLNLFMPLVDQGNIANLQDTELSRVYGYSILGGVTNIILPKGYKPHLVPGQTIIDGQTELGGLV